VSEMMILINHKPFQSNVRYRKM